MSEETMPATEAAERNHYELAFHILPTVAEEEVPSVFDTIKSLVTTQGGEITDEEAPQRFELAYEVVKHIDTKNRKFNSAYFGWVRFTAEASVIEALKEGVDENTNILRHILIKLTKLEEANPFRFHESLEKPMVENIEAEEVSAEESTPEDDNQKEDTTELTETTEDEAIAKEETA